MQRVTRRADKGRNSKTSPSILFVDDQAAVLARSVKLQFGSECRVTVLDPEELKRPAILNADLILVDFDLTDWHSSVQEDEDDEPIARRAPQDGLALIAQLKSIGETAKHPRPTSYALHTGQKGRLPGGEAWNGPSHLLARALNVEWVFEKNLSDFSSQMVSLARAAAALPRSWPTGQGGPSTSRIHKLLGLDKKMKWATRASEQVAGSELPLGDFAVATHGLAILRWMLHTILPYPTFLIDDRSVALRLGVTVASLRVAFERQRGLKRLLTPASYEGVLSDFLGQRWWRAGVDSILWTRSRGAADPRAITELLVKEFSDLKPIRHKHPVALLNDDLLPGDEVEDVASAVEVRPEGWPIHADRAWVALKSAREHPTLRALVVDSDTDRVSAG